MKTIKIVIKVFFCFAVVFGLNKDSQSQSNVEQNSKVILDKDYFLLGTLSDYLGREKTMNCNDYVDDYYSGEYLLMRFIMNLYSADLVNFTIEKNHNPYSGIVDILKSEKIAKKMNAFYTFKFEGGFKIDSSFFNRNLRIKEFRTKMAEFNASSAPKDTVYIGMMKSNLFTTKKQRFSFILGAYSRYGVPSENRYCITLYNSSSKLTSCLSVLKELKCSGIELKIVNNIPTNQLIYFKPSQELKMYLDHYSFLKS
jgi:hypothetical protein